MTKTKTINPIDYIAIDVSKATLQVQDDQRSFAVDNDSKGYLKLLKHLKTCQNPLVVFEASGGSVVNSPGFGFNSGFDKFRLLNYK
jgi:hypothetical protein